MCPTPHPAPPGILDILPTPHTSVRLQHAPQLLHQGHSCTTHGSMGSASFSTHRTIGILPTPHATLLGNPSYLALCFPRILPLHTSHGVLLPAAHHSTTNASSPYTAALPWILRTPHTAVPDTPSSTPCASRNTSHYTWLSQDTTQSTRCSTSILLSLFLCKLLDLEHFLLPTLLSWGRLLATRYSARILTNPHAVPHGHFVLHTVLYWGHLLFHTTVHSGYILLQTVLSGKSPIPHTVLPNILRSSSYSTNCSTQNTFTPHI